MSTMFRPHKASKDMPTRMRGNTMGSFIMRSCQRGTYVIDSLIADTTAPPSSIASSVPSVPSVPLICDLVKFTPFAPAITATIPRWTSQGFARTFPFRIPYSDPHGDTVLKGRATVTDPAREMELITPSFRRWEPSGTDWCAFIYWRSRQLGSMGRPPRCAIYSVRPHGPETSRQQDYRKSGSVIKPISG
ncbi:hypothetical protein BU16DRAFT_544965 [Lophium mytilinum]|uniref:Uncharacterized protein n=1 Tax=Lophium mytilinum TaxID=390894 RepID=A0A6A6Q8N5_9PEZI|nr:hypothetical protein BU16DRAFT_544965 [Lophium mytilinum]